MRIFKKPFGDSRRHRRKEIPDGLWNKCPQCSHLIFRKALDENLKVCAKCGYHFTLTCWERLDMIADEGSFIELDTRLEPCDPLKFEGQKKYVSKLAEEQKKTGLKEAVITGQAKINKVDIALGITDSRFIMGSMGSVVGEKIVRLTELALKKRWPLVIISGSGGGARMYEGMLSLMQMAKTSGALELLKENNVPFVSVLTHPTMAGVMASFAGLGDVTIAEPGALIGFTGPRVIKQTIKQDLPKGFQTSEFNLEHGMVDLVVPRKELKDTISKILCYLVPA
ncbi:MAG: acetyl-CoA carboxylase carboxyltransferase subunit beta [Candidatus Omnitrophota bacterium]|nr:MAG: acetyl-CoA carboxylase carboxyltransferase subunit beta [Candidatus Omnitrophota bacterium]